MTIIKAVGDMTLDVLAVPFGGPDNKDLDNEYFDVETDLHLDRFKDPLILYHHGAGQDQGAEVIGQSLGHEIKPDGVWLKVQLDKASRYAKRVWAAAQRGLAAASSGTVAHLMRRAADGRILDWPLVELSLFDIDKSQNRQPANPAAVAVPAKSVHSLPAAQAIYKSAGRSFPELDETVEELQARARAVLAQVEHMDEQRGETNPSALEELMEQTAQAVTGQDNIKVRRVKPDNNSEGERLNGVCKFVKDGHIIILVDPDMGLDREWKTYLHEISHSFLHNPDSSPVLPTDVEEWEAKEYMGFLDLISTELVKESGREPGQFPTIDKMAALKDWAEEKRS